MKTRSRMTGLAIALTLSMGGTLAACGGSDDGGSDTADSSSTSAPAGDPTADPAPSADADTDTDSGDAGKPSRDDVVAGYTKVIEATAGANLPGDIVKQVVTCFVDELYDDASTQTLQAIADAEAAGIDPKDAQLFTDASSTCTAKITG